MNISFSDPLKMIAHHLGGWLRFEMRVENLLLFILNIYTFVQKKKTFYCCFAFCVFVARVEKKQQNVHCVNCDICN